MYNCYVQKNDASEWFIASKGDKLYEALITDEMLVFFIGYHNEEYFWLTDEEKQEMRKSYEEFNEIFSKT